MNLYTPQTKGYYIYPIKQGKFLAQRRFKNHVVGKVFFELSEAIEWLKNLAIETN